MSEPGGASSRDTHGAVGAATKLATARARSQRSSPPERRRSGSLVLTAVVVIAVLVGMLWLMLSLN